MVAASAAHPTPPVKLADMTTRRSMLGLAGAIPLIAASGGPARHGRIPDDLKPGGALDRLIAERAAADAFSGTVLLTHRGRPVLHRWHGMANKQLSIPNGPDTIFALASVTKLFTAVAIAQLAQRGRLSFQDKVGAHLPAFPPETADRVTIHHLLTHSSGLGDHHGSPGFWERAATWTTAEQVMSGITGIIREMRPAFVPGSESRYSNSGYHLLGEIVAAASGQSYHDYVRDNIFRPAGMASTGFHTRPQRRDDPRIARPYAKQPSGERVDIVDRGLFIGTPAGDALSTCADLQRFAEALLSERLLDRSHTRIMLAPKLPLQSSGMAFQAYGPIAGFPGGQLTLGHGGGSPGASTTVDTYPDSEWNVLVLSNYEMGTVRPLAELSRRLITSPTKA
jgi:CubicO group peptidase (beta-lactamase class C family)